MKYLKGTNLDFAVDLIILLPKLLNLLMLKPSSIFSNHSSPSKAAQNLFNLPKNQYLYENYSCTLWNKIFIPGHLYCLENYLCFYGKLFGLKNKVYSFLSSFL